MRVSGKKLRDFKKEIWRYYKENKRELPWRRTTDPYKIVVSEVMLQQTQVARVLTNYPEFIKAFPNFQSLAEATTSKVLKLWQGMGYNRRALYLRALARMVVHDYKGRLSDDPNILIQFPAIGSATAGSIVAFAFNKPTVFLETNIRRVFLHFFFKDQRDISDKKILPLIEQTLDKDNPREWYYALMDYGAMLAKSLPNPNRNSRHYTKQKPFAGSDREIRGAILKLILSREKLTKNEFSNNLSYHPNRLFAILDDMVKEGFLTKTSRTYKVQ